MLRPPRGTGCASLKLKPGSLLGYYQLTWTIFQGCKGVEWNTDNPLALAWCAGILDGEACIAISRSTRVEKNGRHIVLYTPSLHVNMVHLDTLKILQRMFGGAVYKHSRSSMTRKQAWTFGVTGQKAVSALKLVAPYMLGKRDEAMAVIGFYDLGRAWGGRYSRGIAAELMDARERLCMSVREMKNRQWLRLDGAASPAPLPAWHKTP
jgi:hypothetical protein